MDKNYNVDDILSEIKRKKERQQGYAPAAQPPAAKTPPSDSTPKESMRPSRAQSVPPRDDIPPVRRELPLVQDDGDYEQPITHREQSPPPQKEQAGKRSRLAQIYEETSQAVSVEKPEASFVAPEAAHPLMEHFGRNFLQGLRQQPQEKASTPSMPPSPPPRKDFRVKFEADLDAVDAEEGNLDLYKTQMRIPRIPQTFEDDTFAQQSTQSIPLKDFGGQKPAGFGDLNFGLDEADDLPPVATTRKTHLGQNVSEEDYEAMQQGDDDEIEEYNSPKDKASIIADFKSIKLGLLLRLAITFLLFGVSLYLAFSYLYKIIPLPDFMWPETSPRVFMIVNSAVAAVAMLVCSNIVGSGLLALCKLRADSDTLPALAGIATLAQGVAFIVKPDMFAASGVHLFFPVAILGYIFNLIGKIMLSNRIARNFKLVSSEQDKISGCFVEDKNLLRELTRGLVMENFEIAYGRRTQHLASFLELSYSDDQGDNMYRIVSPVCLVGALIIGVASFLFNDSIFVGISSFTAILCACSPFTSTLVANFPMDRLSTKINPDGEMVSGYSAVEKFSQTEGIVLSANDLFAPENVILHGIKAFDEGKIDKVILDAASVICSCNATLSAVFVQILGGNTKLLKAVDSIVYEDSMGLSAWVDGKRVLIGNRKLMTGHGIPVPSKDYEQRLVSDGRNVIYLSNSGELSALFVVSYHADEYTKEQISRMTARGLYLIVNTKDPNITAEKIAELYGISLELVKIMPASSYQDYENAVATVEKAPAEIGFVGSGLALVHAVLGCISVKASISVGLAMQLGSIFLGYGLITLFTLLGKMPAISFTHLLLYQGLWTALSLMIPNMKKL